MSDKNPDKDLDATVGAETIDDANATGDATQSAGVTQPDAEQPEHGVTADVNDEIAAEDARNNGDFLHASATGDSTDDEDADVNESGVDALDISFAADIAFEQEPDADALLAQATSVTSDADDANTASDASIADASIAGTPTVTVQAHGDADAAGQTGEPAAGDGKQGPAVAGEDGPEPSDAVSSDDASLDAHTAADQSAAGAGTPAGRPVAKLETTEEAIVSSRIDAEVRRRRGIVVPDEYPVYALSDVTVARAKTGDPIIEHVDCSFFNGYVNAILVDSDEERQTVMALLAGLAMPTVGRVLYRSKPLYEYDMHEYRGHEVGFVFQRYNLRQDLSALRNIMLAMDASGRNFLKAKDALARQRLADVGFPADRIDAPVRELSVMELRRAEIARALCCEANMLILDEPTGGLSRTDADEIMALLARQVQRKDRCVIIVTMSESVADRCDSTYEVNDLASAHGEE